MKTEIHLRDYLKPGGHRPYEQLVPDMEHALAAGDDVTVVSVPGFLMAFGHPSLVQYGCPWSDGDLWYKNAQDCINKRNGKR